MRLRVRMLPLVAVVAACSVATGPTTTGPLNGSADTTTAPSTTSTATTITTTTTYPPEDESSEPPQLVVANDLGVFIVTIDGWVAARIEGPVAAVVDDGRGGFLYQKASGRTARDQDESTTTIMWDPAGPETGARPLVVPTPGTGQRLTLHDAYTTAEGIAVIYTRHDGSIPYEDMVDRLRLFDSATGLVTELHTVRGHEWWLDHVSAGGQMIAFTEHQMFGEGCVLLDEHGEVRTSPGVPTSPGCFPSEDVGTVDCPSLCALSSDGALAAYWERQTGHHSPWDIAVRSTAGGTELARVTADPPGQPCALSITHGYLLVNTCGPVGPPTGRALIYDLDDLESPIIVDLAGSARFVDSPLAEEPKGLSYLRYGDDGVYRHAGGTEIQLVDQPVRTAFDDGMGGLISVVEPETSLWQKLDGTTSSLPYQPSFTAIIDGVASLGYTVPGEGDPPDVDLRIVDLRTLEERTLVDVGFGGDGWSYPSGAGGELFVGVEGAAVGCGGSDARIVFWDSEGARLDHPHNPVAEPCGPCELGVALSPDGARLAYSLRPDAPSEYHGRLACYGWDTWLEETASIPTDVIVIDLRSGREVFRTTAPFPSKVQDFDGRFLVVERAEYTETVASDIYDITTDSPPLTVTGQVALVHPHLFPSTVELRVDGLGAVDFGDPAIRALQTLELLLGPPTETVLVDQGAENIALPYGFSANHYFAAASWYRYGLTVTFSDASYFRSDGEPHFIGWTSETPVFGTSSRIRVGSTVEELERAFGESLELPTRFVDECGQGWYFSVGSRSLPLTQRLRGRLSGDPTDPETRVRSLYGGAESTC